MALAANPRLLLADEPTTALDVTVQGQVLALIADLVARLGLTLLLISHDLGVIGATCRRVVVMYSGSIVEDAPAEVAVPRPAPPLHARPAGGGAGSRAPGRDAGGHSRQHSVAARAALRLPVSPALRPGDAGVPHGGAGPAGRRPPHRLPRRRGMTALLELRAGGPANSAPSARWTG